MILNPLQAMESVSRSVDVLVYECGAGDYELYHLGNNSIDLTPSLGF